MDIQLTQSSLAELSPTFAARMAHFEDELSKASPSSVTISLLTTEFAAFKLFIKDTLSTLQKQIEMLTNQVDTLEMRGRRKMLLLHSVPEPKNEVTMDTVVNVIKQQLGLTDFTVNDIRRCHHMGRSADSNKPRTIAIKFESTATRDTVWFAKTKLKGSGITLSEFLTKQLHEIFVAARERFGISQCWTREGVIYICGSDGVRHRVISRREFDAIAVSDKKDATKPNIATKARRNKK